MKRVRLLFVPLLIVLAACSTDDGQQQTSQTDQTAQIQIGLIDGAGFKALLSENKGRVLLINVWATWCVPCREEFPDLVRLADHYRGQPVNLVGISADFPDELASKVRPFLQKMQANFPNYIQNFKKDDQLIALLNDDWRGDLPATFIYDGKGRQLAFLSGKQTFESFQQAIESARKQQ